jgi:hypothetical protein
MYANPLDFRQCCVTALAALLLMDELHEVDKLFTGTNQDERFAKALRKALASDACQTLLRELGRYDFSPHSTRKGSAAFASNGSTYAANFVAVTLRAGWSLGDVLGRYFKYDAPMDAFLGRILAGLDVNSPTFATLPPRFVNSVDDALLLHCFPAFLKRSDSLGLLRFILPSLVHHHTELARMLPRRHRLHASVLFMDSKLRQSLDTSTADSLKIRATGVPPHVTVLRQGASIESKIDRLTTHLIAPSPLSPNRSGAIVEKHLVAPPPPPSPHKHTSSKHGFPEDFELPLVGPLTAWRLLLHGDKDRGLPPFRLINPKDFPGKRNLRKRLSDWLYFYNAVRAQLDDDTDENASDEEQFLKAWRKFDFPPGKIKTRPDQWKLATVVLKLRENNRPQPPPQPPTDVTDLLNAVRPRDSVRSVERKPIVTAVNYKLFLQ